MKRHIVFMNWCTEDSKGVDSPQIIDLAQF